VAASRKQRKKPAVEKDLLDAFLPRASSVGDVTLQPLSFLHYIAFDRIASPLIGTGTAIGLRDVAAALLICSLPPDGVTAAFAGGIDAFWADVDRFAGRLSLAGMLDAPAKLSAHLEASFSTAMRPASSGDDAVPFVPPPEAAATPLS